MSKKNKKNTSREYDMRICSCGRIHMIPEKKIHSALRANKNLGCICGGCGKIIAIGADAHPDYDEPEKTCYDMYTFDVNLNEVHPTIEITPNAFTTGINGMKPFSELFYSLGIKVPMMTGEYARSYFGDTFCDMWYPDWYKVERIDVTVDDFKKFIADFKENQKTVNMDRFIHDTPEEFLQIISRYWIKAFDWRGTKYDNKFN